MNNPLDFHMRSGAWADRGDLSFSTSRRRFAGHLRKVSHRLRRCDRLGQYCWQPGTKKRDFRDGLMAASRLRWLCKSGAADASHELIGTSVAPRLRPRQHLRDRASLSLSFCVVVVAYNVAVIVSGPTCAHWIRRGQQICNGEFFRRHLKLQTVIEFTPQSNERWCRLCL